MSGASCIFETWRAGAVIVAFCNQNIRKVSVTVCVMRSEAYTTILIGRERCARLGQDDIRPPSSQCGKMKVLTR